MKNYTVAELMVPVADYVTIDQEATLAQAVAVLRSSLSRPGREFQHRAILATDRAGRVVGKLSLHDVIMALEPGYRSLAVRRGRQDEVPSSEYIRQSLEQYSIWQSPLDDLGQKGFHSLVKEVMTPLDLVAPPVFPETSLAEACHAMLLGGRQSLLVADNAGMVVGVLRLSDIFIAVSDVLENCKP